MVHLKITYKRARIYVHSPDTSYQLKLEQITLKLTLYQPNKTVIYFQDECTIYSHASVGYDYSTTDEQPLAKQGLKAEQSIRIAAALNPYTGEIIYIMRESFTISSMVAFYKHVADKSQDNTSIYMVQDNWTQHWHPDVQACLEPQQNIYKSNLPPSWANIKPDEKYMAMNLPIQIIPLPTYASWLNPIEKLWRMLKQEILHDHLYTDDFTTLKQAITDWFAKLSLRGKEVLQYTGLLGTDNMYSVPIMTVNKRINKGTLF